MGDGSLWGALGQWVADPAHRLYLLFAMGSAAALLVGIFGRTGRTRRNAPVSDRHWGRALLEIVLGFLLLAGIGGMVAGVAAPGLPHAVSAFAERVESWGDGIAQWVAGFGDTARQWAERRLGR